MNIKIQSREPALESLDDAVTDAAAYLAAVDEMLSDGRQTARGILSQMIFWHEEYVRIAQAIAAGDEPDLKMGTFDMLNAAARQHYHNEPMPMLAHKLTLLQRELAATLRTLPDWSVNFPVKRDSGFCNVNERLSIIEQNIRNRVLLLKRAAQNLGSKTS